MTRPLPTFVLVSISLITVIVTLLHGALMEVSIFHGLILHPIFVLLGLVPLTFIHRNKRKED